MHSLADAIRRIQRLSLEPHSYRSINSAKYAQYPIWCSLRNGDFIEASLDDDELVMTTLMMSQ